MSLVYDLIKKEKARIEFMLNEYHLALETLPKGTITKKNVGNKTYFYLKYRDGKKIVSKYVPNEKREQIEEQLSERKHIDLMIESLNEELKFVNKALGGGK